MCNFKSALKKKATCNVRGKCAIQVYIKKKATCFSLELKKLLRLKMLCFKTFKFENTSLGNIFNFDK